MSKSWYRIANQTADSAELYIHDEIGMWGVTSKDFTADLRALNASTIKLHLNSPGGSVDDGIAIYNALKAHPGNVEVYVDALAASAASFIAMAGDRIVMAPHSRMMIHEAQASGGGNAADFQKMVQRLQDCTKNIASIYNERASKGVDYWLDKMAAETWYSDKQAVDEGLADEVGRDTGDVNAFKIAAKFDLSKYKEAAQVQEEFAALTPERNDISQSTVAATLASCVSSAFTDTIEDWLEDLTITVPEHAQLLTLLSRVIGTLDSGLSSLGIGDRQVDDDDEDEMPMQMTEPVKETAATNELVIEAPQEPGQVEQPDPITARSRQADRILVELGV